MWNATADEWQPVGSGVQATSKVTFDLSKVIGTKWHHGINITWADVIGTWAYLLELTFDPEKSQIEGSIAGVNAPILEKIKGFVFDTVNNTLTVYVDYWHFDVNYIANYAVLTAINPIELHEAMFYLAFNEKSYALSDTRAEAEQIPQLSLVLSDHAADVKRVLESFKGDTAVYDGVAKYVTVNGQTFLTQDEWEARLDAAINWIDEHGHAWISQGSFYIDSFNPEGQVVVLKAFRDPTYPFKPGDWYFGTPTLTKITRVFAPVIEPGAPAQITVKVQGEQPITVSYVISDPATGEVLATGAAENISADTFVINLPADLTSNFKEYAAYELLIIAKSEKVALLDYTRTVLQTTAALTTRLTELQQQLAQQLGQQLGSAVQQAFTQVQTSINALDQKISDLDSKVSQLLGLNVATPEDVNAVKEKVTGLEGAVGTLQALIAVTLVLVLVNIALLFVAKRK